ncbi:MAG TPA: hypothetical protein H9850_11285 [Candidatus Anaerobiospirillum pullistercoris]|uniref:Uncharacterized protein n=1 Tax=Candidatus Anaerobiospirillum pullistercoris TaxID=2838452 RepID=A0A9D2B2F9_9GAMM|nr:hypothetical protein [Candidatus Anaerobiospirillum pullistercoris]
MRPTQDQLDKLGELLYQQPSLSAKELAQLTGIDEEIVKRFQRLTTLVNMDLSQLPPQKESKMKKNRNYYWGEI